MLRISPDTVLFHPETGDVEPFYEAPETNPTPKRALELRRSTVSTENTPEAGALRSGVGVIDWDTVLAFSKKDITAFKRHFSIASLLEGNTKTEKERPTGRKGEIAGLTLAPHFYPNLLEVVERNGRLVPFDKDVFNSFNGSTADTALEWLKARRVPSDSFVLAKRSEALGSMLDFCVGSSKACRQTCLVYSGQNPSTKEAPISKMKHTLAFLANPELFVALLRQQLLNKAARALGEGYDLVVRLNMLSDIPWYVVCPDLLEEAADAGVAFYDYTKVPFWNDERYQRVADILDLTFSYSGANEKECREALKNNVRVAAAFAPANPDRPASIAHRTSWQELLLALRTGGLPGRAGRGEKPRIELFGDTWPLIDGDKSDYRMDDPAPSVVALNFKAPNLTERRVPGITERMQQGRERFTVKVGDPTGQGAAYALARASAKSRWKAVDADDLDAEDAIRLREQFTSQGAQPVKRPKWQKNPLPLIDEDDVEDEAVFAPMPMHELTTQAGVIALIGPHVPTVLND